MSQYILSATLEMKDKMSAVIKTAKKNVSGFKDALASTTPAVDRLAGTSKKLTSSALEAASGVEKATSALDRFKGTRRATVSVTDNATSTINRIKSQLNGIKSKDVAVNLVQKGGSKLKDSLGGVASGMMMNTSMQMLGGAGVGFGIYNTIKSYMDFEQTMSGVKAIAGATDDEFQKLTQSALDMGAKTKFTTTEAAQALTYMGMAGWKTNEMISGLPGIMNLAAASGEDLASVSDIVTDAMTSFKMSAGEAGEFADVLAIAASNSNTNVGKMGYTFKYVAPLAGALGYNIQDTALAIGAMADSGIKGEQAGTSLKTILTRLVSPTKDAKDAIAVLSQHVEGGFSVIDSSTGKMKPLKAVLSDLRKGFKDLDTAEKTKVATDLAGQDALPGLLALLNESDEKYDSLSKSIDNASGAAEKMAKIRLDNLAGDLTYLSSAWDGFTKNLLSGSASSGLRDVTQEVTKLINKFNEDIKDGLDVGDVFDVVGTLVIDLKNKFLQLDGVGSVLAGGALAGALYKLAKLTKNGVDAVSDVLHPKGESLPGGAGGGSIGNMTVSANNVIVNGKVSAGGAGVEVPGGTAGTKTGGVPGASKANKFGKIFNRVALGLSAATAAYDVYQAAPEDRGTVALKEGGSLGGMYLGAKAGGMAGAAIGAPLGGVGAAVCAIIGAALGGMGGSAWGNNIVDSILNGTFGASRLQSMKEEATYRDNESRGMTYEDYDNVTESMEKATEDRSKAISGLWDTMWKGLKTHGQETVESIKDQWSDIPGWYDSDVWSPIDSGASRLQSMKEDVTYRDNESRGMTYEDYDGVTESMEKATEDRSKAISGLWDTMWEGLKTHGQETVESIKDQWSDIPGWYDSDVWSPIDSGASRTGSAIESAFSGAWSSIEGVWGSAASWFDSHVISPISSKIAEISANALSQYTFDKDGSVKSGPGIEGKAVGDTYFPGGLAQINEHGGELIDLPQGSRIYPSGKTEHIISRETQRASNSGNSVTVTGNTFIVRNEADMDKIAYTIMRALEQGYANYGGA